MTTPTSRPRPWWREHAVARASALLAGAVLLSALGGWTRRSRATDAPPTGLAGETTPATTGYDGQVALVKLELDRARAILGYSARYKIPADLAEAIYDIALAEGLDPALAFRLVKVESGFKQNARSNMDALGFTQVQLPTARYYDADITETELLDRDTNLRIGFRFLKDLLRQYKYDLKLALLAYNRGPGRVNEILAGGGDPSNGYSDSVLEGYHPSRQSMF